MCSSAVEPVARAATGISYWRDFKLALRGPDCDYTLESPHRGILLLGVPMVLQALMVSLLAIVDVFWVSRLGPDAIVVIGLTESVMSVVYAIAAGMSVAATAIVARRVGEKDTDRAAQSAAQLLLLGLATSAAIGAVLGYFALDVLQLLGASPSVVTSGAEYARLMFGANATAFLIFIANSVFRGAGDAVVALRTLLLANALNVVLAPCFIFGWGPFPELGITGAAVTSNLARVAGLAYQLWYLTGRRSRTRVRLRHWRLRQDVVRTALSTSIGAMAQPLIITTSSMAVLTILTAHGSAAVAGYTIALRIGVFALLPAWGVAAAAATLVGQNLGASQPDRSEAAVRVAARLNVLLLSALGVLFIALAEPVARLFTNDSTVAAHAIEALRLSSLAFPFYAVGICFGAAFNGAGDTWTPLRTSFICLWLGQVPLAWLLSVVVGLEALGVYIAVPAGSAVLAVCNYVLFTRGRWKLQKV
jgi:putative MATE family efflux protein